MDRTKILDELKDVILMYAQNEKVSALGLQEDDILLNDQFGIDSITFVSILVEIERRFNIEIEDEFLDLEMFTNLRTLTDYVYELVKE